MSDYLKLLAGLCLVRTLLEILMPEGGTRRLVHFALGLLETVCILNGLIAFLRGVL